MKRFGKDFWVTLLIKQNRWHKHNVLVHTLKVAYHLARKGRWDMVAAGLLHDIAKPLSAYQDERDIAGGEGERSFTNHEAMGYYLIKDWKFISTKTKDIVRYHYLIRGMHKAKKRGQMNKYNRQKKLWNGLTNEMKADLGVFLACDDLGKK